MVEYFPGNDGTYYSVRADITNDIDEDFEHAVIRFIMPNEPGTVSVGGGTLMQADTSGTYAVYYVAVDIPANSYSVATLQLTPTSDPPVVEVVQPDGGETWDIDSAYDITWTATDDVGVTSIDILLSTDGGGSYGHTISTGEANDGTYSWLVDVDPATQARVKVIAYDADANTGEDDSDADFEINDPTAAVVADHQVPTRPVISGNLPNPFSARTVIRFGIPEEGRVRIALYDVKGRRVAGLAEGDYEAGYHEVVWENDGTAGTGLYFFRLTFGSEEVTYTVVVSH
jgi:hypothetical protein